MATIRLEAILTGDFAEEEVMGEAELGLDLAEASRFEAGDRALVQPDGMGEVCNLVRIESRGGDG